MFRIANPAAKPYWVGVNENIPEDKPAWQRALLAGGVIGGVAATGFIPVRGKKLWDYYLEGIRYAEETSPYKILRTFHASEILSPFGAFGTTASGQPITIEPDVFKFKLPSGKVLPNRGMRDLTGRMLGIPSARLEAAGVFDRGLEFTRRPGSLFGSLKVAGTNTVLTPNALPIQISGTASSHLNWLAKIFGVEKFHVPNEIVEKTFFVSAPMSKKLLGGGLAAAEIDVLHKVKIGTQLTRAHWAAQIGRFNALLQSPSDFIPVLGKWLDKLPTRLLAVEPGTATQMLARYSAKMVAIGIGLSAFQYASYLRGEQRNRLFGAVGFGAAGAAIGAGLYRSTKAAKIGGLVGAAVGVLPLFDQGIIEGGATLWARSQLTLAQVSQSTGLTQSAKEQEQLFPGITKIRTGVGLIGAGTMLGTFAGWGIRTSEILSKGRGSLVTTLETEEQAIAAKLRTISQVSMGGRIKAFMAETSGAGATSFKGRLMVRGGRMGALAGAALYGMSLVAGAFATGHIVPGVFGMEETPEELEAYYTGRKEVPIKKGRWWELGTSPYEGGKPITFLPSWYHRLMTDARTKGLYGSAKERWAQSALIHPVQALTSDEFKYRWEREHYEDRPYPVTASPFADVPFIGPLLEPVGYLIKPKVYMHAEDWMGQPGTAAEGSFLYAPSKPGEEPVPGLGGQSPHAPVERTDTSQVIGEFIYRINELRGLPGFTHRVAKDALTGDQDYFTNVSQLQTPLAATGAQREYWEKELGGLLGMSEVIRRAIPKDRTGMDYYNPIPNKMPAWLPGDESEYFLNFRRGDPYTKVAFGELRLPGPGYAALHPELEGVAPENYGPYWKYKILADVAPGSNELMRAKIQLLAAQKRGELTEAQLESLGQINRNMDEKRRQYKFQQYKFSEDAVAKMHVTVKGITDNGLIMTNAGPLGLAGTEIRAERGTETYRRRQAIVADFLREHLGAGTELDVFVHRDPYFGYKQGENKAYYRPVAIPSLQGPLLEAGVLQRDANQADERLLAQATYSPAQQTLGKLWEQLMHTESPLEAITPVAPMAKFVHARTALEEYEKTRIYGRQVAMWQHPLKHFIEPAMWRMRRETLGTTEVPEHVQKRWEIEEYFDKLKYMKFRMLEQQADESGEKSLASQYRSEKRKTLMGVNPFGDIRRVLQAVPRMDREFFAGLLEAEQSEREKAPALLAPGERELYFALMAKREGQAAQARAQMGVATEEDIQEKGLFNLLKQTEGRPYSEEMAKEYKQEAEGKESYAEWSRRKELDDYFRDRPLPKPNWIGWDPNFDLEDAKLRLVQNQGQDMHDYNLWENREKQLGRKPYVNEDEPLMMDPEFEAPYEQTTSMTSSMRRMFGMRNVRSVVQPSTSDENVVELKIDDNRSQEIRKIKRRRDVGLETT